MKTQLHALPNWQEVLCQIGWREAPDAEAIEKTILTELSRGRISFEPADMVIEAGCRVTLKTESNLSKFNREKTVVTVGSRLYHPVIEGQLIGMEVGQTGSTEINGELVTFHVTLVERKVYPSLTDALVQSQNIGGVETLEQYRSYITQKLRKEFAEGLCNRLLECLLTGASMDEPDSEDIQKVIDREFEPLRARFSGSMDMDNMSEEEWKKNFYNPGLKSYYEQIYPDLAPLFDTTSKASYYANRRPFAVQTIRRCLVLNAILGTYMNPTENKAAEKELISMMVSRLLAEIYKEG